MLNEELALEQCCRRLVALGKRQGGYLTYEALVDILRTIEWDPTMEALDWLYERLTVEGIELVDELPDRAGTLGHSPEGRQSVQGSLRRARVVSKRQRKRHDYSCEDTLDQQELIPCPEEVIDEVLWQAENGSLSAEEALTLIGKCGLSELETSQLLEYLGSKGVDLPEIDLFDALKRVPEQDGFLQDEDEPVLSADPGVQLLLRDMAGLHRLTAREERELARLAEEGNREAASRLIEANLWHVFHLATNYLGMGLDFLDLFQEGCIGLMKAVGKFDWRSGNRLCSYASWWIMQTIGRAIAEHGRVVRLPVHMPTGGCKT